MGRVGWKPVVVWIPRHCRAGRPSTNIVDMSAVLSTAPARPDEAAAHFAARLAYETDVSDVHADLEAGAPGLIVVDSRSVESWQQGHLPGAVHLPTAQIAERAPLVVPRDVAVV